MEVFYDITFNNPQKNWTTNQSADNVSTNKKIAKILGIKHAGCENHLLNSGTKEWHNRTAKESYGPGKVVDEIHETMKSCKTNKNSAVLRQETHLTPSHGNETRWLSRGNMMEKWERLETHINEASLHDDADIVMPRGGSTHKTAVKKATKCYSDILEIARTIQKRGLMYADARKFTDLLMHEVEKARNNDKHHWHKSKFGKIHLHHDSKKRSDHHFLNAVIKVQRRMKDTLTRPEVDAIKEWMPSLKKKATNSPAKGATLAERMKLQAKEKAATDKAAATARKTGSPSGASKRKADEISLAADDDIGNLDHVLGSAAEVERVWSWARYVLTTQRARMAPVLFEAIMFLKFNRDLWDEKTVQLAYDLFTKDKHDEYAKEKVRKAAKEAADIADDADDDMEYNEAAV